MVKFIQTASGDTPNTPEGVVMNENFAWGQQGPQQKQPVVAMTANDAQNLVSAVVTGVTKAVVEKQAVDALAAYKESVSLGNEVTKLRDTVAQREAEIAGLHQHIARLNQVLSSIQATPVQPVYAAPTNRGVVYPQDPTLAGNYLTPEYLLSVPSPSAYPVPTPNGTEG
jgi:hypothetical protein